MKRAAVLVTFLVLGAHTATGNASVPARNARVVGAIRLCGGPAPGRCFSQDGFVSVLDSQHHLVSSQHTRHARFSFNLAPGAYTLEAKTGGTARRVTVLAQAHKTTKANIVIPIR
jgi:hypothetical protein